ncbi:hypothetical protein SAMN05216226_106189 [Halovenus aranensis]|uniref:Uncharacterized protein n=1 Tax=Halovenus aranensis TaxID=890420 RepID=A0A1G8VEZ1_9EURY|nr:hypothetical protein [Halovenus aranensis]SDJ64613.1 hypothetical protein SAMN05216226_106189 [Halovenus aranensis]
MAERRQYTGTQRLQIAWSLGIFVAIGLTVALGAGVGLPLSPLVVALVLSVVWFVGLGALGLRERSQWNNMVEASSFTRQIGPHTADLENIVEGRSVTVSTAVQGVLSQTHTEFETSVNGVDASFTVEFERSAGEQTSRGVPTSNETLDDNFVVRGTSGNVDQILTTEVESALLSIETPGTCTVTGDAVTYEVPFTALAAEELETIAEAIVVVATRVEEVGQTA